MDSISQGPTPRDEFNRFCGTAEYITSPALEQAVNAALALGRPLLVKGEPGTGKTVLAVHIARALELRLIRWHIKSTSRAADGLCVYDTVQRLHDSRFGDAEVSDIKRYIRLGPLGDAFTSAQPLVLLIDEVDKADVEFPNDLLNELDLMELDILETGEHVVARQRPIVVITSNNEKELPDAFLRRCIFHYIDFPDEELLGRIVHVHYPDCIYKDVYRDSWFREAVTLHDLLRTCGPRYKLILVGDALMHPMELLEMDGALDYWHRNFAPGIDTLGAPARHFERAVWLNPEPREHWSQVTVRAIRRLFPMYPLTLDGLDEAVAAPVKARPPPLALD